MKTTRSMEDARTEGTVEARDTRIYWRAVGSGSPVVAVHGGPGLGHHYLRALEQLADRFRVIFWDQRGSGRTELGDQGRVGIAGTMEDLEALLDGLEVERATLLGHSLGADLSAIFASRRPDRVASLVLANPGPPFDPEQQAMLWTEMERRRSQEDAEAWRALRDSDAFSARDPRAMEQHARLMYMPFFNDRHIADSLDYGFTEITAWNFAESEERVLRDLDPAAEIAALGAIRCPTLVLYGEDDPIPEAFALQLVERIPGARYAPIEGANHFSYLEAPEAFFSTVRSFLEEVSR